MNTDLNNYKTANIILDALENQEQESTHADVRP